MTEALAPLAFEATADVQAAILSAGRTEDVRFSPGNGLLALAGYSRERCLVLRVRVELTADGPRVWADDYVELTSDGIGHVHGLDFIDDQTLVVANRDGHVSILELPTGELAGRHLRVEAIRQIKGTLLCRVKSPGSVAVRHEPDGVVSILVCNNYLGTVTRHVIDQRDGCRIVANRVFLGRSLEVPDGIALSNGGDWIAVSSHSSHDVKMFATAGTPGRRTPPAGTLGGGDYPHGVRFSSDDRYVLVADAGAPVIHVYERGEAWGGTRAPVRSVTVLSDEVFARGRVNPAEGGPKGMDIDKTNQVVAVTCEEQSLTFYGLSAITGTA